MGIFSWILMGLLAGAVAKWLMPGKDPGGCFITIILGIAGGVVGGYLGTILGFGKVNGFNLASFGLATTGAVLLLFIYRLIKNNR
ncbi:GlsB/YeaQ/YmgE family stress response membrane protein [Neptunomonas japonica]|uniref:GlsB/YeaQ/YmgE family stress response membrane protein n=1 Tax=Neptunomonas japonica TaxID=417574 RepID=UPI0003FC4F13|nr:GlsB/YeaQ/YmgE family stress response membrane protein [Neptunomonas japonica]